MGGGEGREGIVVTFAGKRDHTFPYSRITDPSPTFDRNSKKGSILELVVN